MKRKALTELKGLIEEDLEYHKNLSSSLEGDENPQVKEMYDNAKVRIEAFEDILMYINDGNKLQFSKGEKQMCCKYAYCYGCDYFENCKYNGDWENCDFSEGIKEDISREEEEED